jgi:tetratricopeptide (TPR) repeat protein
MKRMIGAILLCAFGAMIAGCAVPNSGNRSSRMGLMQQTRRSHANVSAISAKKYFEKGQYDKAIQVADQIVSYNASDGAGWYWLGAGYFMKQQYSESIPALKNALQFVPDAPAWATTINNSYYYLGNSFLVLGNYDESLLYFNRAIDRNPNKTSSDKSVLRDLLIGKAFSSLGLGQSEAAIELLKQAKTVAEYPNYSYHLSLIYYAEGNKEKAWEYRGGKGMVGAQVKDSSNTGVKGAEVVSVVEGGPAEKSGMLPGDVITGLNEKQIQRAMDFLDQTKRLEPGRTATVSILREGMTKELALIAVSAEALMESDPAIAPMMARRKVEAGEYQQATSKNTLDAYAEFLRAHPSSTMRKAAFTAMSSLIKKQEDPYEGYKKFVADFQDGMEFIPSTYRLSLIGPEGMRVNDILELLKQGIEDTVVAAKIRMQNGIYKDFDAKEMVALKKMGVTGVLIEAMLDSTTRAKRAQEELQKKKDMENLLAEIQHAQQKLDTMKAAREQQQSRPQASSGQESGPSLGDTVKNCAAQIAALEACKHLPWPANSVCAATAKSQFPCQ